jgi:hypothetical protein
MRALITALVLLVVLPASAEAKRSPCQRLKGSDRAPAANVKLVKRPNEDRSTDLFGCLLPRGKVQLVAFGAYVDTTVHKYAIRQVAGPAVLIGAEASDFYNTTIETYVYNLRRAKKYVVATFNSVDTPFGAPTAKAAFITPTGAAVAAVTTPTADAIEIRSFTPEGKATVLDTGTQEQIPPASLALKNGTATWTHDGEPRSAPIG